MGLGELAPNPNHVKRDEALKAMEEGKEYASATGIDAALEATDGMDFYNSNHFTFHSVKISVYLKLYLQK